MKKHELADMIGDMGRRIEDSTSHVKHELQEMLELTQGTNSEIAQQQNAHDAMNNFVIYSYLASKYTKLHKLSKDVLDIETEADGSDPTPIPNEVIALLENDVLTFTKRQNKNGTTTLLVDVLTALQREGVDKDIIDAALFSCVKVKRGNVYYEVNVTE